MYELAFICLGTFIGVTVMCLLQISKGEDEDEQQG